jgi:Fic family protein
MKKNISKNILGEVRSHINGYNYLHLYKFPDLNMFKFDEELLNKANKAQFLLGKLSGITKLIPDVNYFLSSYVTKDATSSSQIEGTKATVVDVLEFGAMDNLSDKVNGSNDSEDVVKYINALNFGLNKLQNENFPISLRFVRGIHKILMTESRSSHFSDPGNFRKTQNWINGLNPKDAEFVPIAPEYLMDSLGDLEDFFYKNYTHPIIQTGILHAQFETIHPFLDGNGRTGRLLITFNLLNQGVLEKPVLFLSSFFKKNQNLYYLKLNNYHNGDINSWINFFLEGVIETAEEAIILSENITKLRDSDIEKISSIKTKDFNTNINVLRSLYQTPILSTQKFSEITKLTKTSTLDYIEKLIKIGIIELYKKGEGKNPNIYIHRKYVNLFN